MSRKPKPPGRLAVEAGSVDGGQRTRLVESSTGGVVARGRLYFVRETTLLAQAFDSRTLAVSGDPVPVAEDVWRNLNTDGLTAFSVAEDGTLAYRGGGLVKSQLTWLDRQGQPLGAVGPPGDPREHGPVAGRSPRPGRDRGPRAGHLRAVRAGRRDGDDDAGDASARETSRQASTPPTGGRSSSRGTPRERSTCSAGRSARPESPHHFS